MPGGDNIVEIAAVMVSCVGTLGGFFMMMVGKILKSRVDDAVLRETVKDLERRLARLENWRDDQ